VTTFFYSIAILIYTYDCLAAITFQQTNDKTPIILN